MISWQLLAPIWYENVVVLGYICSDAGCYDVARWLCFWPGQENPKCDAHRIGWERVANALGFRLRSVELAVREWPEPDPSAARFAAMELT